MREFELLARLRDRLPPDGPRVRVGSGDDAAVTTPAAATATSVDATVDGVHFRRQETAPRLVGRKAISTALSDLAAMGAAAGEAYVAVAAPEDLEEEELLALLDGILEVCAETATTLAGGDVTRGPGLMLAVTVVGHAARAEELVTRGGAETGDLLVLTGELGGAAAGRLLLDNPVLAEAIPEPAAGQLRVRQLDPTPRLRSGVALAKAGAHAMIDISDGLAGDASHVARASEIGLRIDSAALPIAPGVGEVAAAAGCDPLELAVAGGEDYELLAALPPRRLEEAAARIGAAGETTLTPVGEVHQGTGTEIRLPGGGLLESRGFDHFAGR